MIAYLNGILAEKDITRVVVECAGVGYEAYIPLSTFDRLPAEGERVKLFTHHEVREDAQILFGFATAEEREAEAAREEQRAAEREEQRKQLLAIQEELRRVRETKAAEKAKEAESAGDDSE